MKPALKKCRTCREWFTPEPIGAKVCSEVCAMAFARSVRGKAEKIKAVRERKADAVKRENLKTRADWLKEAKTAMQGVRRLEELAKYSGCMSCGRSQAEVIGTDSWKPGGAWDGGHFLSKGSRPELALEPLNIWLQCKSCNGGSGKYARKGYTVNASFRLNLIERIGLKAVEALEADHRPRHYTISDLAAIKADCAAKTKALKAAA